MRVGKAVDSGKRFKRKQMKRWLYLTESGYLKEFDENNEYVRMVELTDEDITADDWEVEENRPIPAKDGPGFFF